MTDLRPPPCGKAGDDGPTTTTISNFDLEYPEIPLHLSLESLLAHSSSSAMPASESNPPSLDDSWASLGDIESSNEDDLQSEHTDVGSLLDVHSSDDIQSVTDDVHVGETQSIDDEGIGDTSTEDPGRRVSAEELAQQDIPLIHPSIPIPQAARPVRLGQGPELVRIHNTIRTLSENEIRKLPPLFKDEGGSRRYSSIIRITLSEDGLDPNSLEYFKVVLLGKHAEQFRPEIQRKLGDALVSRRVSHTTTPRSISRFHLVPNTFGPGSEPEFADLVAIDNQIDFDCYDLVKPAGTASHRVPLILSNSQTRSEIVSKWDGSTFVVTNTRWVPPDLAVICVHLDQEYEMDDDSLRMLTFAERHGIPHILIRMDRGWHGDYGIAGNLDSLHESLESRLELSQDIKPFPKLPVDMAAFLNLDSALLNKHIAYVISTVEKPTSHELIDLAYRADPPYKKEPSPWMQIPFNGALLKTFFITLWIVGIYIFLGAHLWPVVSDSLSGGPGRPGQGTTATAQEPSDSTSGRASAVPKSSQAQPPILSSQGLEYVSAKEGQIGQQLVEIASVSSVTLPLEEDALHFQVGIAGENQLVVKLPKFALNRKKRSQLSVVLTRSNQTIPATIQELFDGVFSVQLHHRDTYGDIEVNLTMTKPQLSETLTVSFGNKSIFDYAPLKGALNTAMEHLQEMAALISGVWPYKQAVAATQDHADVIHALTQGLKEDVQKLLSWRLEWKLSSSSTASSLQSRVSGNAQALYSYVVLLTNEGSTQGRKVLAHVLDNISKARSAIRTMSTPTDMSALVKPSLNTKAVVDKLGAAQVRARQIVANAAGRVRSRHGVR
ncbi:uncharacterized protein Z518_02887 [Rhinocladiella mackenziei CBS 650.93]|uniref:Uncharacterized protein n=1 Tax=Rhinocladiella mackenziei CBS 650.93 TaxID=1442369 RepID=A0A0D2IXW5_9EURO|nr:uncharacterized protein Z518_02887 [Rhinocladiella mackenziei CBS 650.93]KIX08231.1 hypothetical protein Z518_02887 [Rhinocladiella mackenziei CBS 650.93]